MTVSLADDKARLRERARSIARAIDWIHVGASLRARLAALPEFSRARRVALFSPMPTEPDFTPLLVNDPGRAFFFPRCGKGRSLAFHQMTASPDGWIRNAFGMLEPDPDGLAVVDVSTLDLVVVPAVALAKDGARLGHGAGYYDRFLPSLSRACRTIGALPDALVFDSLPTDSHDIPLDFVLTETALYHRDIHENFSEISGAGL